MQERIDTDTLMNLLRPMPVHQRVATVRKLHGLSQQRLADKVDVERGSVSSWEADPGQERAHSPSEEARSKMARLFGLPAYVFTPDFGMQNFTEIGMNLAVEKSTSAPAAVVPGTTDATTKGIEVLEQRVRMPAAEDVPVPEVIALPDMTGPVLLAEAHHNGEHFDFADPDCFLCQEEEKRRQQPTVLTMLGEGKTIPPARGPKESEADDDEIPTPEMPPPPGVTRIG